MALDQKERQYNEAHNSAIESAALAQKHAMSMDLLKARLADQTRQLDAYIDNPMTIPGSHEEQVAVFKKQVAKLQEHLEIERHTKMMVEAASYQAAKQQQLEKEALEARNRDLVREIEDLQNIMSQANKFQDLLQEK